jgi:hypothetical protein
MLLEEQQKEDHLKKQRIRHLAEAGEDHNF